MGNMVWVILGNLALGGGNLGILGKGREMVDVILIGPLSPTPEGRT